MVPNRKQSGVVLVVGLVMLVLLTLMAVAAFKFGKSNFVVVSNQQTRVEATKAAEQVIEQIVANTDIALDAGANLFGTTFAGATATNQVPLDVNGDGTPDYTVTIEPPQCVRRIPIMLSTLHVDKPNDSGCMRSEDQASKGIEGAASGESLCSEVVWDLRAEARDRFSGDIAVTVVQGLGQRVSTNRISLVCD